MISNVHTYVYMHDIHTIHDTFTIIIKKKSRGSDLKYFGTGFSDHGTNPPKTGGDRPIFFGFREGIGFGNTEIWMTPVIFG